ncbi:hypothetical protein [Thalassotalea piscium]|uniref:Uncharacterized protein n=1 Tax=Thalassotalea piscium TaxID=1230533 RepID=A0A7X0NGT1_9GAMM|nr:hypothetical protein [Thalassotalea piscium]MBB6543190.1 hypothetical protein [Thalassotalea piscium]
MSWFTASLHLPTFDAAHYLLMVLSFIMLAVICTKVFYRYRAKSMVKAMLICAVNLGAILAMLLLILPIYQTKAEAEHAIIITNNTDESQVEEALNRFKDSDLANLYIWIDNENDRQALIPILTQSQLINDVIWLTTSYPLFERTHQLEQLYLYGDGLLPQQLASIKAHSPYVTVNYFPSQKVLGIVEAKWSKKLLLGEKARFEAKLQSNDTKALYDVELTAINNDVIAKKTIRANETFRFNFVPKAEGINEYFLNVTEIKSKKILAKEVIPLEVVMGRPLNILVKTASPSFEIRHLKNWMAEQGSTLTIISQTSKSAFLTQAVNSDVENNIEVNKESISTEYLAAFDMLMLDGRSLVTLSLTEQSLIIKAVKKGLALFVFVDETLIESGQANAIVALLKTFSRIETKKNYSVQKPTLVHYNKDISDTSLTANNINLFSSNADTLVFDDNNQTLVLSKPLGFGDIVLSTLNTSYQWKLSGKSQDYGQYWQFIFNKVITTKSEKHWLAPTEHSLLFPLDNISLCYLTEEEKITAYHLGLVYKPLKQPVNLVSNKAIERDSQYCVEWFANESGWHQFTLSTTTIDNSIDRLLTSEHSDIKKIYVNGSNQWLAWQQLIKRKATQSFSDTSLKNEAVNFDNDSARNTTKQPLNKLPIWFVFIALCTLLWVERKRA